VTADLDTLTTGTEIPELSVITTIDRATATATEIADRTVPALAIETDVARDRQGVTIGQGEAAVGTATMRIDHDSQTAVESATRTATTEIGPTDIVVATTGDEMTIEADGPAALAGETSTLGTVEEKTVCTRFVPCLHIQSY
jgi:hypothetical protein